MAGSRTELPVSAFANLAAWEAWLAAQPPDSPGIWLKLAKKDAGVVSITRAEAVEGALCHGWIDGQAAPFDDRFWLVRFTMRRRTSRWSQVNRTTALALMECGRMRPAGLAEVDRARADGRWDAAYAPPSQAQVPPDLQAAFASAPRAELGFAALDRRNRYAVLYRIQDAKKPETRARRIATFIAMLEQGESLYPGKL